MKKLKIILQSNLFYILLFIFIALYVFVNTVIIKNESKINKLNEIVGIVTKVDISENKISFLLKSSELIQCNYYKENFNDYKNLLGKKIKIEGEFSDLNNNTIPNTFNYKQYLYNNKIYNVINVNNIEILEEENIFYKIKNKIIKRIDNYDEKIKSYLNIFILGNKSYLDSEMYDNYRINGIWHLFAISGMHISLIILVLNKILSKVRFKNYLISIILFYFMFLCSFSASVMRSVIFFYLNSIIKFLNIEVSNKKILFLTSVIILLFDPFMIFNIGFQYSFLITYAIMNFENITGNYFIKLLKISIISFVVSLPITINLNYEVNILSIFLNIIYVPFISLFVFPVSILSFILPMISVILNILINLLEHSINIFEIFKLNIIIPKLNYILIIFYYTLLIFYVKFRSKKLLIINLILIVINIYLPKFNSNFYIYYLDVGQGDSSILISPYQKETFMIDTGGNIFSNYHISNNIIIFLKSLGISKLNSLIITHGDFDHMGESINLVNNFNIDKVIFNCGVYNDLENEFINILNKKNIPYISCINELNIVDYKLHFLNTKEYDNENDNSNVIYFDYNNYKFLFMGDAGIEKEKDILEKYNLKVIDFLKVGHHGSNTSSSKEFIDSINPKYSLISVGKNNRYGHPKDSVLNNLSNSKIYRTDIDGSVEIKLNKNGYKIITYSP